MIGLFRPAMIATLAAASVTMASSGDWAWSLVNAFLCAWNASELAIKERVP